MRVALLELLPAAEEVVSLLISDCSCSSSSVTLFSLSLMLSASSELAYLAAQLLQCLILIGNLQLHADIGQR